MVLLLNISIKSEGIEIHTKEANNSGLGVSKHPLAPEVHFMLDAALKHLSLSIPQQTSAKPTGRVVVSFPI